MKKIVASLVFSLCLVILYAQKNNPAPTSQQLAWHDMGFYLFVHFGPNTFTDLEWGHGTETEDMFNPSAMDCRQWCRIAKAAGAKGIIITAKHHDGFCLWPSQYSTHTVAQSKWRNGKGDVLKDLRAACDEYGLKMGVYLSPWDRNHPAYGTEAYNDVFVNMMKEVIKNYGPFFEFWWDGANGEGPNGKRQIYDWQRFQQTMRSLAPNTVVFSDIGPDIRWVGNENGIAGKTNWNKLDTAGFKRGEGSPPTDTLNSGNVYGKNWIPAECDVSIRPGWFYHEAEDKKVKTPEQLFDLYIKSVGRGANLLLNVPPDRMGLINGHDSAALIGFKKLREESFADNLLKNAKAEVFIMDMSKDAKQVNDGNANSYINLNGKGGFNKLTISLPAASKLNCIVLSEWLQQGQFIDHFAIELKTTDGIKTIDGTTIGKKRIITFSTKEVAGFTLIVHSLNKNKALISEVAAYLIDDGLVEK